MGVMSCYRTGCESIMCDTYIDNIGYVCNSCQKEFKTYCQTLSSPIQSKARLKTALRDFLETEKDSFEESTISIDDFFAEHTTNRW